MSILNRSKRWSIKPPPGAQINRGHPLAQGLVGAFLFNEGGGLTVRNLAGQASNGALTATTWAQGPWGSDLVFNGTTFFVTIPSDPKINNLGPLTIVFWGLYNAPVTYFLDKSDGNVSNGDWMIDIVTTNTMRFRKELGTSNHDSRCAIPTTGIWFQFACTWTGVIGTTAQTKMYVNGRSQAVTESVLGSGARVDNSLSLQIAKSKIDGTFLGGQMDHLLIYNRVLSPTEIAQLYGDPFGMMIPQYSAPKVPGSGSTTVEEEFDGAVTPAGAIVSSVTQVESGTVTPTGQLFNSVSQSFAGAIEPAGAMVGSQIIFPTGEVAPSGEMISSVTRVQSGAVASAGALRASVSTFQSGSVSPAGALIAGLFVTQQFGGSIGPTGEMTGTVNGETPPSQPGSVGETVLVSVPFNGIISGSADTTLR